MHLPSDAGDGVIVGVFADRTSMIGAKREFITALLLKGLLAFVLILPVVLVLAHYATTGSSFALRAQ